MNPSLPPSFSRRHLLGAALSAPALALAQPVAPAGGRTLRYGFIGPGKRPASGSGWALAQGHLLRELAPLGISEVTTHVFPNGPDLNEAFLSGAVDVGVYGDTPATVARARGLDGRLIGFDNVGMNVWLLTPHGGVKTVKALEGKVVAVALGSYMHRYVLGLLKEAGILKTTKVVYMLPRDGEVALEKGAIAAFAAPINTGPLLASKGFPVIDQAEQHPHLRGSSIIVAANKLVQQLPGLPAAWQRARRTAVLEMRKDIERYYAFHAEVSGFPVAAIRSSYPVGQFFEQPYPPEGLKLLEGVHTFLREENLIREDVDLVQWRVAGLA